MARLFARLKLRLIVNGLRRGRWYVGAVVLGALFVLPYMAAAAVGVALLGRLADLATVAAPALVVAVSLLWLGWVVGPVLVFGADETLDPARLRLLPLRRSQLAVGLLAASAVGVGPLATVVVLAGVVVGFARPGVGAVVVVAAAVVEFLLCLTAARAVTTALSRRLASRRGRDVVVVAGSALALVFVVLGQAPQLLLSDASAAETSRRLLDALARTATAATVLPGAWPARAVAAAAGGDLLAAVGWLGAAAAAAAGFAWWWMTALEGATAGGAGTAPARRAVDLFPAAVRFLPRNRLGAGVAKDLRYLWRVPQLRAQLMTAPLFVVLPLVPLARLANVGVPAIVLAAPVFVFFTALVLSTNAFGGDRGAVWLLDATGPQPRTDLYAKALAAGIVSVPVTTVVAVALAALGGGWRYLPVAVALGLAVQAVSSGVGLVVSVYAPMPLPESTGNLFASRPGQGCGTVVLGFAALAVQGVLLAPVTVGVVLAAVRAPALLPVVALAGLAGGAVVLGVGVRVAAAQLQRRGPEFVAALSPQAG